MRARTNCCRVGLLLFVATVVILFTSVPAQAQPPPEDAEAYFRRGKALYAAGNTAGAYEAYKRSHELRPSYDAAGNAGQSAFELERWRDACNHLGYSLGHLPASMAAERRTAVQQRLRALLQNTLQHVGRLRVTTSDRAELFVDDVSVGYSPLDPQTYCVDVGSHTIRAELAGHSPSTSTVAVMVGETTVVQLPLSALRAAPTPDGVPSPGGTDAASSGPSAAVLVPLGVGAAASLGLGIGLMVLAEGKFSDADAAFAVLGGGNPCIPGGPNAAACQAVSDLEADGDTLRAGGIAMLAVGGAATVGALVYGLWPRGDGQNDGNGDVVVVPVVGGGMAGVMVAGGW